MANDARSVRMEWWQVGALVVALATLLVTLGQSREVTKTPPMYTGLSTAPSTAPMPTQVDLPGPKQETAGAIPLQAGRSQDATVTATTRTSRVVLEGVEDGPPTSRTVSALTFTAQPTNEQPTPTQESPDPNFLTFSERHK